MPSSSHYDTPRTSPAVCTRSPGVCLGETWCRMCGRPMPARYRARARLVELIAALR